MTFSSGRENDFVEGAGQGPPALSCHPGSRQGRAAPPRAAVAQVERIA
jgi:hypothetical protein